MIDGAMNALVGAPAADPKTGGASTALRDEAGNGGFKTALSKVRDERQSPGEKAADAAPEQSAGEKTDGAAASEGEASASRSTAIRALFDAALEKGTGRADALPDALAGQEQAKQAGDGVQDIAQLLKGAKSDRRHAGKNGEKDDETAAGGQAGADKDAASLIAASLDVPLPAQAPTDNPLVQIAQAVAGNKAGDRVEEKPRRGADSAQAKIDAAMKETGSGKTAVADAASVPGVGTGEDDKTVFRFQPAGGGRAVEMAIGRGEGRAEFEVRDGAAKGAETVTVLDSRRYLGLAPSGNAAALTGLIAGDREWVGAMQPGSSLANAAAQGSTGRVVHTLKLHLTPVELGSVTLSLRLVGDELAVHMTVENSAAYRKLQDDSRGIMEALKAQGLSVDQLSISVASVDRSDQSSTQTNNQQAQQGGQPAAEGRNRDESAGRNGRGPGGDTMGARDERADAHGGIADTGRGAGVYL